jgi:hypothetical protein
VFAAIVEVIVFNLCFLLGQKLLDLAEAVHIDWCINSEVAYIGRSLVQQHAEFKSSPQPELPLVLL